MLRQDEGGRLEMGRECCHIVVFLEIPHDTV